MAHLLFIKAQTVRNGQQLGDFVLAYDFPPTATEKEIFEHIEVKDKTAAQIMEQLEARKDPKKEYPKFPFNRSNLVAKDLTDLANGDLVKKEAVLDKITLKAPTGDVDPIEESQTEDK